MLLTENRATDRAKNITRRPSNALLGKMSAELESTDDGTNASQELVAVKSCEVS